MRYLAITWNGACPDAAAAAAAALRTSQATSGWIPAFRRDGLVVLTPRRFTHLIADWGPDGVVCGESYRSCDGARGRLSSPGGEVEGGFRRLCRERFGRYVAIRGGTAGGIFRDPSGGVECLVWRVGPLILISSELAALPSVLQPLRLALDWNAVARALGSAAAASAELALAGLVDVAPGAFRAFADLETSRLIWSPAALAAHCDQRPAPVLAEDLQARVEMAVAALVGARDRVAVEVSGGLDSAIIAATLGRLGLKDRVTSWLNYFADRPEGDERAYARAVTGQIGEELSALHLPVRPLVEADFTDLAAGVRPPMNALVPVAGEITAQQLASDRATALVSGQGGDAALYQMPSALVLADELRRRGPGVLLSSLVPDTASLLRRSVWSVAAEAICSRALPGEGRRSFAAVGKRQARAVHPWVRDAATASPGKRLQIIGLANAHVATGAQRLTQSADLLYPLFAQPVVEWCLGVPAAVLQHGGRERGLARLAFADRLPAVVIGRRKKGELSAFHAQTVAASLDFLRPYLLEGSLCDAGVIDRSILESALHPERLLQHAGGGEILMAAALEAWVRHWQRYVPDSEQAGRRQFAWARDR